DPAALGPESASLAQAFDRTAHGGLVWTAVCLNVQVPEHISITSDIQHLAMSGQVTQAPILVTESLPSLLQFVTDNVKVVPATPVKRTGKSMSRRTGQEGHVEPSGRWWVVRWWMDVPGQEKRRHMRERICPISDPGRLSKSERQRRAREIV